MMFSDPKLSHAHSLETLTLLNGFYDFKKSIKTLLDVGCGSCLDLQYWADMTVEINDNGGLAPLNINCYGIDKAEITHAESQHKNINVLQHDFNNKLPFDNLKFDVVWCHDTLQYSYSPIQLLRNFNDVMTSNSMLYLCVPSTTNIVHNKFKNYTLDNYYNTFTLTQLIYLLALNGFDVKDAYFKKEAYEDIIEVVTYKISDPLDYNTTWYELQEKELLSETASGIVNNIGYLTDQGLVTTWVDGNVYDYRHHS